MTRRICTILLTLCLSVALLLPVQAETSSNTQFLLGASQVNASDQRLTTRFYTPVSSRFLGVGFISFSSKVNWIVGDASAYIQVSSSGTRVSVGYLTDLNGDGIYEFPNGLSFDALAQDGTLISGGGFSQELPADSTCALSAETLLQRGEQILGQRAQQLDCSRDTLSGPETILYMVMVYPNGQSQEPQCYYLQILDRMPILSVSQFRDVQPGVWYYRAVDYAAANGLMSGTSSISFSPNGTLTRAMLAQILYADSDCPSVPAPTFQDVEAGLWYSSACSWASQEGLMAGVGENLFGPNQLLTRQQFALILFQYAAFQGVDTSSRAELSRFSDQSSAADWAREALEWAVSVGLLSGRSGNLLAPGSPVTRAECACILRAFQDRVL